MAIFPHEEEPLGGLAVPEQRVTRVEMDIMHALYQGSQMLIRHVGEQVSAAQFAGCLRRSVHGVIITSDRAS